jgi:hypothetical protein
MTFAAAIVNESRTWPISAASRRGQSHKVIRLGADPTKNYNFFKILELFPLNDWEYSLSTTLMLIFELLAVLNSGSTYSETSGKLLSTVLGSRSSKYRMDSCRKSQTVELEETTKCRTDRLSNFEVADVTICRCYLMLTPQNVDLFRSF